MMRIGMLLLFCLALATVAHARRMDIGISYSSFRPIDDVAQEQFGENWDGFGIGFFDREAPQGWGFTTDFRIYSNEERGSADLYIYSVGLARGLAPGAAIEPYVSVRGGLYYGRIEAPELGINESGFNFNANASLGVLIRQTVFVEARYDYFTDITDINLDGIRYAIGVRVGSIDM